MTCDICGQRVVQLELNENARIPYPDGWHQYGGGGRESANDRYDIDLDICPECNNEPLYRMDNAIRRRVMELDEYLDSVHASDAL